MPPFDGPAAHNLRLDTSQIAKATICASSRSATRGRQSMVQHRGRWLGIAGRGMEEGKHRAMDHSPLSIFVVTGRE